MGKNKHLAIIQDVEKTRKLEIWARTQTRVEADLVSLWVKQISALSEKNENEISILHFYKRLAPLVSKKEIQTCDFYFENRVSYHLGYWTKTFKCFGFGVAGTTGIFSFSAMM